MDGYLPLNPLLDSEWKVRSCLTSALRALYNVRSGAYLVPRAEGNAVVITCGMTTLPALYGALLRMDVDPDDPSAVPRALATLSKAGKRPEREVVFPFSGGNYEVSDLCARVAEQTGWGAASARRVFVAAAMVHISDPQNWKRDKNPFLADDDAWYVGGVERRADGWHAIVGPASGSAELGICSSLCDLGAFEKRAEALDAARVLSCACADREEAAAWGLRGSQREVPRDTLFAIPASARSNEPTDVLRFGRVLEAVHEGR